jgi:cytochrome P450
MFSPVNGAKLEHCRSVMTQTASQMVDRLPMDTPFPLLPHLQHAVLDTWRRLVVGDQEEQVADAWRAAFRTLHDVGATPASVFHGAGVLPIWPRVHRARQACDRLIDAEIARRRRTGEVSDDVLASLLSADAGDLSDAMVRDHVTMMLMAVVTTAIGTAWAIELALRHPASWQRVVAEAVEWTGDAYTEAVAREALRLRPPLLFQQWRLRRPLEVSGHMLPSGTRVQANYMALHHHPDLYPNPSVFQPERFLGARPPRNAWMPFGVGQHACPGGHHALTHIKTLMHAVARSVTVLPAAPRDERARLRGLMFIVPAQGCRIIVQEHGSSRRH